MKLKKHDFIEIEYTGRIKDGDVFDTTDEKTAKESGLNTENARFGPVVICLGENHVLPGIENKIIGSDLGNFKVDLTAENAFGKKSAKLLKLMPMKVFKKQDIQPFPGLEVNIDNQYGIVRTVSGGRVIVDFNHPLSGHDVSYEVKVNKKITSTLEKARSMFRNELNIVDSKLELKEGTLVIDEDKFPKEVLDAVEKRIKEVIPAIKKVVLKKDFKEKKPVKKTSAKKKSTSKKSEK